MGNGTHGGERSKTWVFCRDRTTGIVPETGVWPKVVALVVAGFAAMGYTVSRANVKNG